MNKESDLNYYLVFLTANISEKKLNNMSSDVVIQVNSEIDFPIHFQAEQL